MPALIQQFQSEESLRAGTFAAPRDMRQQRHQMTRTPKTIDTGNAPSDEDERKRCRTTRRRRVRQGSLTLPETKRKRTRLSPPKLFLRQPRKQVARRVQAPPRPAVKPKHHHESTTDPCGRFGSRCAIQRQPIECAQRNRRGCSSCHATGPTPVGVQAPLVKQSYRVIRSNQEPVMRKAVAGNTDLAFAVKVQGGDTASVNPVSPANNGSTLPDTSDQSSPSPFAQELGAMLAVEASKNGPGAASVGSRRCGSRDTRC